MARADGKQNANSSLVAIRIEDRGDGTYRKSLVNIFMLEGTHFEKQAKFLKQKVKDFDARILCVDINGLGRGLVDYLTTEIDENPPYSVVNDDSYAQYKKPNSIPMLFAVSAQKRGMKNSDIINHFMATIANNDVKMLVSEAKKQSEMRERDGYKQAQILLPFIQTDRLIDEIMNLEYVNNGNTGTVKQVSRKIQKDRYSAFAYGLFWIYLEESRNKQKRKKSDFDSYNFIKVRAPKYKRFS